MLRWLAPLASLLVACQSAVPTGAPCTRSSECDETLVCAGGACRAQCADARDCTTDASCVTFRGTGVCVPPAQPVPCVFNADCGADFCRSGQCVRQCTTDHDCERGTCASGACTEPILTPGMPDAGVREAGVQCGAPEVLCRTDGRCHDLRSDAQACGQCGSPCAAGGSCEAGRCVCAGTPCAPVNDQCADALPIVLDETGHGSGSQTFVGATADLASCGPLDGPDVFFRVHLERRSVLGAHARDAQPDIMQQGCGPPVECGPLCAGGADFFDLALVEAGDVFIALRTTTLDTPGLRQLFVTAVPVDDLAMTRLGPGTIGVGTHIVETAALGATSLTTACSSGDAHGFYWQDCGGAPQTITACGTGTTALTLASRVDGVCAAADGTGCATISNLQSDAPMVVITAGTGGSVQLDVQENW